MQTTKTHLIVTYREVNVLVALMTVVGLVLAFFGLSAAITTVGAHSTAGHIIVGAIIVTSTLTFVTIIASRIIITKYK